ncbi:MAG: nucleoside deaminase [Candidatus Margulisiibacteriota bacterium]
MDKLYMSAALKEAQKSLKTGDVPIGAVAVVGGKIIARAHNEKEKRSDATAHAELLCLQKAAKKLKTWRLYNVELYTTLEPCHMCKGAMALARIKKLVYGTRSQKKGLNHKIKTVKNTMRDECSILIKDFFRSLRTK